MIGVVFVEKTLYADLAQKYCRTYDGGNILTATEDGTFHTYTYGNTAWKDQLTAYDGQTITYDAIGNPLTYRDGLSFTW